jgi:NAD(P)-dependent dehydrogenase (short-subunit alcohol dehydrogenase family)
MSRALEEQVVVITGASSGIGRETALAFGAKGATVVLAARSKDALEKAAREIELSGGQAHVVVTDVADWKQVEHLAEETVERFGRIDTWVNNAAVSEYAEVWEMTVEEIDRIVQVILMGQIYGMKAALPHMQHERQGTIVNVASALAYRAIPLQSAYCASKHGIKGFTESLRLELKHAGYAAINVTLVMPSSIDTPLFTHARSKMGVYPQPVPPIYDPSTVAEAILFVAQHPRRDVVVGAAKIMTLLERISPALADWYMLRNGRLWKQQKTEWPDEGRDNLFEPMEGTGQSRGKFTERSKSASLYTRYLGLYPNRLRALVAGAILGLLGLVFWAGRKSAE